MRQQNKGLFGKNLFGVKLLEFIPHDHPLVELRNKLPWDKIVEIGDRAYQGEPVGNEKIDPRIMTGILIYHSYFLKKTYRELTDDISYNIIVQYFCGFEEFQLFDIDHSTIVKFEENLGEENIREIMEIVEKVAVKNQPPRSKGTSGTDTTVIQSNIEYPTDMNLLEKIRIFLVEFILENQHHIGKEYRTYSRTARNNYISFSKKRKITKKDIKKSMKSHLQYVKRNLEQAEELVQLLETKIEEGSLKLNSKEIKHFKKLQKKLINAREIYEQQLEMYRKGKLPEGVGRIVSFHRKNIRPIFRGKRHSKTEFGLKVTFSLIGKAIILGKTSYKNFHDGQALRESIHDFEKKGYHDKIRVGDKGLSGCTDLMKEKNIKDGIERRGKQKTPKVVSKKIFTRERSKNEGCIGVIKNIFFGNHKSRAKSDFGDMKNILKGSMGYNLRYAF